MLFTPPRAHQVSYSHEALLVLEGATPGSELLWSTDPSLNAYFKDQLASVEVRAAEIDSNADGKVDAIDLTLRVASTEPVIGLKLAAGFQYGLEDRVRVDMTGVTYVSASSARPCSRLSVDGDLAFQQRAPLADDGSVVTHAESALQLEAPGSGTMAPLEERISFASFLAKYNSRNETAALAQRSSVWESGTGASGCEIHLRVRVPPAQEVSYIPGALEVVKFAWVQFLAVYIIFAFCLRWIEWVVFHYRILPTRIVSDVAGMRKTL